MYPTVRPYVNQRTLRRRGIPRLGTAVTAGTDFNYRRSGRMGDLFNDIMSTVVGPTWDERPQWMKDVKVNVNDVLPVVKGIAPDVGAKVENLLQTKGEAAAQSYFDTQVRGVQYNPIFWVGGGILLLVIVGQMLPKGRRRS